MKNETFLASVCSDTRSKEVPVVLEILDFIKETDESLLETLICFSDFSTKKLFINESLEQITSALKIRNWFQSNLLKLDKNQILVQTFKSAIDGIGDFIHDKFAKEKDPTADVIIRLNLLKKEFCGDLFPIIIAQHNNFLYKLCLRFRNKSFLPNFIQSVFTWTELAVENFNRNFLISVGEGNNHTIFSSFIREYRCNEAESDSAIPKT